MPETKPSQALYWVKIKCGNTVLELLSDSTTIDVKITLAFPAGIRIDEFGE